MSRRSMLSVTLAALLMLISVAGAQAHAHDAEAMKLPGLNPDVELGPCVEPGGWSLSSSEGITGPSGAVTLHLLL